MPPPCNAFCQNNGNFAEQLYFNADQITRKGRFSILAYKRSLGQWIIRTTNTFLRHIEVALVSRDRLANTPDPLKAQVLAEALSAVEAAKAAAPTVLQALTTSPAQLAALTHAIAAIELPHSTPTGIPYDAPLSQQQLGVRAYKVLWGCGVTTIRQFCGLQLSELLQTRNLGKVSLRAIKVYRAKLGVPL